MMALHPKNRTDHLPDEHKIQAHFAISAFNTLKAKEIAYISVPITSGRRLYDYMQQKGFKTQAEAKADRQAFYDHVMGPNFAAAIAQSEAWTDKINGAVIAPAEFEKRLHKNGIYNWGQDDYMGMWVQMIEDKVTHMVMTDGWEYSNGSGEEYLLAVLMQMGRCKRTDMKILDGDGKPLTLDRGIELLSNAFVELNGRGIRTRNMAETLSILFEAEQRYAFERTFAASAEPDGRIKTAQDTVPAYNRATVKKAAASVKNIMQTHYPDIAPTLAKVSSFDFTPMNAHFRQPAPAPKKVAA